MLLRCFILLALFSGQLTSLAWLFPETALQRQAQDTVVRHSLLHEQPLVTQEIRYSTDEAGEVFLVWGVDGWQVVPDALRPPGTVIKDSLMYTPMQRVDRSFIAEVRVSSGATIDYAFQITKTQLNVPIEVWDVNGEPKKDYHTVADHNGIAEVQASPKIHEQVAAAAPGTWLTWAPLLALLIGFVLFGIGLLSYMPGLRAPVSGFPTSMPVFHSAGWSIANVGALSLLAILLVAAALRLNHITQPFVDAFSWRETSVAMMADNFYRKDWNIFYPEVSWNGPGPGYQGREFQTVSYIAALLYLIIGQHDWVGRAVAVVFGVWGVFALYQLVRRVWDEPRALAAAAIMAVLPSSVVIERSFLPDPAMVALVVTSFWMLVAYLQTDQRRYLLLAGVIGMWGFLTKIPGLIVGLPMVYAVLALLAQRQMLRPARLVRLAVFALLMLTPVAAYYLWVRHLALSYPPYHFAGDGNWLWQDGLSRWMEQSYFLPDLRKHLVEWMWTTPMIAAVVLGLVCRVPISDPDEESEHDQSVGSANQRLPWLFHWWMLAGLVYYAIGAQELVSNPWNFHILDPAAAALAGHALIVVTRLAARLVPIRLALAPLAAILIAIAVSGQAGLRYIYEPYSNESYEMGTALSHISRPGELVVTIGHSYGDPVAIYYSQRRGWGFPPADPTRAWDRLPDSDQDSIRFLEDLRAQGADWLGIVGEHRQEIAQAHPALAAYIERTCDLYTENEGWTIYRMRTSSSLHNETGRDAFLTPLRSDLPWNDGV